MEWIVPLPTIFRQIDPLLEPDSVKNAALPGKKAADELTRNGREFWSLTDRAGRYAEAAARLQHPNIVQIHEVGEANGQPYCALEFVEGAAWPANSRASRCRPGSRPGWSRLWRERCNWPTAATWSTATSSRPTSCWLLTAPRRRLAPSLRHWLHQFANDLEDEVYQFEDGGLV